MLPYVIEDQNLLSGATWIQVLQKTLIKGNPLLEPCAYTCRKSCKLGFETANRCAFIYNRSRIHDGYTSLQGTYLDTKVIRGARAQTRENLCVL